MRRTYILPILAVFVLMSCSHPAKKETAPKDLQQICETNFDLAVSQYEYMASLLAPDQFPKTFEDDTLHTSGSGWWCSGFYPGTLLYLFEHTGDSTLLNEAYGILKVLQKEQYNTHTHDLGFMMYCSFGNANRINPDSTYQQILVNSARSLSTRFDKKVGVIKSWDSKPEDYLVIIDNMMNLELLFWATQQTGDSSFYDIAITHANTTIKNHFRPDYSSYHVLNYDPETGEVQEKMTAQGYSDESAWARGQVWGLYGFTVMYRFTRDEKYLEQAKHIAEFLLSHPNMPADKILYWDFNAPDIPDAKRDVSATAVMASAFLELKDYVEEDFSKVLAETSRQVITNLSTPEYLSAPGTNGGFLLKHSVGHIPQGTEVDVPLTYADYYFVEAMHRLFPKGN